MILTLSIRRCPEGVPPESRRFASGGASIGRSPTNDWVLPDPDRVLSKQHCKVMQVGNGWQLTDTSVNGTFLNHEQERLDPDAPRFLRDGDRLVLGSYEIEVAIQGAEEPIPLPRTPSSIGLDRLTGDPFPAVDDDPFGTSLPSFYGPAGTSHAAMDPAPAISGNFFAPRKNFEQLPDDWALVDDPAVPRVPMRSDDAVEAAAASPAPPPADTPLPVDALPLVDEAGGSSGTAEQAFAAFAAGAGIDGPVPPRPLALLSGLGAAFRAVVSGLRHAMIARATIKGGFRIEQTMIQAVGNNPLKFSASDDDALATLIGIAGYSDMTAERAVREAMRDIRLHELAMASAMQQAVRDMLGKLAPARIEDGAPASALDRMPGQRKSRLWEVYATLHREMERGLADDFDSVFGRAFMHAYERALLDIAASERDQSRIEK